MNYDVEGLSVQLINMTNYFHQGIKTAAPSGKDTRGEGIDRWAVREFQSRGQRRFLFKAREV